MDNGSSPRGEAATTRLPQVVARIMLVHPPVHAGWLKQVESYFSIIQRKVLIPTGCADVAARRLRLALSAGLSNQGPSPFQWKCDRTKLPAVLTKTSARQMALVDVQLNGLEGAA
jgi:hypothetical protein